MTNDEDWRRFTFYADSPASLPRRSSNSRPGTPLWGKKKTYFAIANACCSACRHWRSIVGDGVENNGCNQCGSAWRGGIRRPTYFPRSCVGWQWTFCTPPASMRPKFLARHLTSTPSAVKSPYYNGPCMRARLILRPKGCSASAVQAAI